MPSSATRSEHSLESASALASAAATACSCPDAASGASRPPSSIPGRRRPSRPPRYEEQVTDAPPVVGTLYLQKYALNRLGNLGCLRVTIEAAAEGAERPLGTRRAPR